ncbi:hypothetical protein AX14_013110, partial [Amanita brunnescens Koide BX004]
MLSQTAVLLDQIERGGTTGVPSVSSLLTRTKPFYSSCAMLSHMFCEFHGKQHQVLSFYRHKPFDAGSADLVLVPNGGNPFIAEFQATEVPVDSKGDPTVVKMKRLVIRIFSFTTSYKSLEKAIFDDYCEKEDQMHARAGYRGPQKRLRRVCVYMRGRLEDRYASCKQPKKVIVRPKSSRRLSGEGEDPYVSRLDALKALGDPITARYREAENRPRPITTLHEMLNRYIISDNHCYSRPPRIHSGLVVASATRNWPYIPIRTVILSLHNALTSTRVLVLRSTSNHDPPQEAHVTPGPQSIPDDWIRHAMAFNARLAATAGVLTHTSSSSIGDIASTFMQMLIHLLDMNENKDEFYQIMTEIESLIESSIRYAREYDAISQGYVKVCNDLLSIISSMESWMAQTFRNSVSPVRRAKTKPYDDVLHNYRLQIQLLRSRLRILTLVPSSSTGTLSNAGTVAINGSTFIDVAGNQYIYHNHGTINVQSLHPDQMHTPQMDDLDLSD